jgi:hypothetical protein
MCPTSAPGVERKDEMKTKEYYKEAIKISENR